MQEYRYSVLQRTGILVSRFFELFGIRRPIRYEPAPVPAGDYDRLAVVDHPETPSLKITCNPIKSHISGRNSPGHD
jgi:hypothetical protein